ncbi:hypothetical protein CKO42_18640 [Lamprobacter modestohalophilus]|uniref:Uncharacterized protein n=1 Tax=Lamprobacter modestohalophilus TaxID=1064514 RepID=A0A9X0WBM2_9GAMM|nr:hypothetical protein [Lamprobacter modestohalophilus]
MLKNLTLRFASPLSGWKHFLAGQTDKYTDFSKTVKLFFQNLEKPVFGVAKMPLPYPTTSASSSEMATHHES